MSDETICPKCGDDMYRESADVGVGIIYGPYGCPTCGYSEDERFDISDGQKEEDGYKVDQWGGLHKTDLSFKIEQWFNKRQEDFMQGEEEVLPAKAFVNLVLGFLDKYRYYEDDVIKVEYSRVTDRLIVSQKQPEEKPVTVYQDGLVKLHLPEHARLVPYIRTIGACAKDGCDELALIDGYCVFCSEVNV